jgi:hypothetical protein
LIQGLLRKNPLERLTIDEVLCHPWLGEYTGIEVEIPAVLKLFVDGKPDEAVVAQMRALDLGVDNLAAELKRGEMDKATAVYKMLRRERHTEELREWAETQARLRERARNNSRVGLAERNKYANSCIAPTPPPLRSALRTFGKHAIDVCTRSPGKYVPRIRRLGLDARPRAGWTLSAEEIP